MSVHRRSSSVISLSTSAVGHNPQKIEKIQSFDRWRQRQTDLCPDFLISGVYLHSHRLRKGNFVIECMGPVGHWMIEKSLKQLADFQKELDSAFPVESGRTGKIRILPTLPFPKCPNWLLLNKEIYKLYKQGIERFMQNILTRSVLIAKSRIVYDFFKSDLLSETDEEDEVAGGRFVVSAPMIQGFRLRCVDDEIEPSKSSHLDPRSSETLLIVKFGEKMYPVISATCLSDIEGKLSFIKGEKLFYNENMELITEESDLKLYCDKMINMEICE